MTTAKIRHVYPCSEDTFWSDILFDQEYNRKLYLEHLGFKQWKVMKLDETDAEIRREVQVEPVTSDLPKVLAKLAGDNLGFVEKSVFDKAKKRYRFEVIPNRLADKLKIKGEIYVEARGDDACERFVELDVTAKMFGIASMVEKRIIEDTQQSYERGFAFGRDYLQSRS